jgi:hypothetical protein
MPIQKAIWLDELFINVLHVMDMLHVIDDRC